MYLHWDSQQQQWLETTQLAIADRAIHYGDGLFETLRFNAQGEIPLWEYHFARLLRGLQALYFPESTAENIVTAVNKLPQSCRQGAGKLLLTRGVGPRGYALPEPQNTQLIWQSFNPPSWAIERFPQGFQAQFAQLRLSSQPQLQGIKHLNRLEQVLARQELSPHNQELVLCDQQGWVIEGAMSNLFVVRDQQLFTPDMQQSGVDGVIRRWIMQQQPVQVVAMRPQTLLEASAVFFCNSLNGIIPIKQLDSRQFSADNSDWHYILHLQNNLEQLFC